MNQENNIVASREFAWTGADGVDRFAYVDITKPIAINNPDPALVDWECEVQTRGFGADGSQTVIGVDSVHALFNALVLAGGLVGSSLVSLAAEIDWAEMDNYGFPRDPNANAGDAPIPPIPDPEF